ncbi:MAG: T9SS type A sorting domain-containing protein [Bacteroidia bacterium]
MNSTDLAVPLCTAGNVHGCPIASDIQEVNSNVLLRIYPNPASGKLVVETNDLEKRSMQLRDVNGKMVFQQDITGTASIDISDLDNGVYSLTIRNSLDILNKKLIITK